MFSGTMGTPFIDCNVVLLFSVETGDFSSSTLYRGVPRFSLDFDFEFGLTLLDWRFDNHSVLRSEPGHPESISRDRLVFGKVGGCDGLGLHGRLL